MKKFLLILVVLFVFASCASPVDEVGVVEPVSPFEGRWIRPDIGYVQEYRSNTIYDSSGTITGTFTYDDTYIYTYLTGNVSHIFVPWKYEFKNNGNELCLTFAPEKNIYGVIPADEYVVYQKIGD